VSDLQRNVVGAPKPDASRPEPQSGGTGGSFYLLAIGIDDYQHWTPLKTARAGAEALAELMKVKYGFPTENVRCLLDRKATDKGIDQELRSLFLRLRAEDSLLLYFAGHGYLDEVTESGAWIPADGELPEKDGASRTWMEHERLRKMLRRCPARHVLLISDSCFAGDFLIESRGGNTQYFRKVGELMSRQVLAAGGLEPVADGGGNGHSVFTFWLLKVLAEFSGDCLPASHLGVRVCKAVGDNADQIPVFSRMTKAVGEQGGEFLLYPGGDVPAPDGSSPPIFSVLPPPRHAPWRKIGSWAAAGLLLAILGWAAVEWDRADRKRRRQQENEQLQQKWEQELKRVQAALDIVEKAGEAGSLAEVQRVEERLSLYLSEMTEENRRLIQRKLTDLRGTALRRPQEPPMATTVSPAIPATSQAPVTMAAVPAAPVPNRPRFESGWTNSFGQAFVRIPGTAVLFAVTETSLRDYARLETNRAAIKRLRLQTDDHPVVNLRWRDATNYAWKLTVMERQAGVLGPQDHYRLPSDHEWSLAAGVSTNSPALEVHEQRGNPLAKKADRWWSLKQPPPPDGNFGGEEFESDRLLKLQPHLPGFRDEFITTAPINSLGTNALGLHHMPGNVSEWCQDQDREGKHWARGAAWDTADSAKLAKLQLWTKAAGEVSGSIGFRLVLVPGE
jgi:hypothetical protein